MNIKERAELVKAMEVVARAVNDEDVFIHTWLSDGVADGDLTPPPAEEDWDDEYGLGYYIQDEQFADLMDTFLYLMKKAQKDGLYCDGVISREA